MGNVYWDLFPKVFPWYIPCDEKEAARLINCIVEVELKLGSPYKEGTSFAWTKNFENKVGGDLWLSCATANRLVLLHYDTGDVEKENFIAQMRLRMERTFR